MPTYDYRCPDCGHAFERFQSMSSPPVTVCPQCGFGNVKRLIGGGAGLLFKGTGFYLTDYKKSSTGAPASSSTSSPSPPTPSSSDSTVPASTPKPPPPSKDKE